MTRRSRILLVLLLMISAASCSRGGDHASAVATRKVVFLYPVKIDALEAVERGVRDELRSEKVEFVVESAQGNAELFQPTVRAAVRQNPGLLIAIGTQITQTALALGHELRLPPIVFTAVTRPADVLPADQLPAPRKVNITGLSDTPNDISKATLGIARTLRPSARRIGILFTPSEANSVSSTQSMREAGKAEGIEIVTATTDSGAEAATSALLAQGVDLVLIPKDKIAGANVPAIVETALRAAREGKAKQPVPVIAMDSGSVESSKNGAVAAASAPYYDIGLETGKVVRRIFSGEAANTIAISGPEKSRIYVNLSSASAFCLTGLKAAFPDAVFSGADDPALCVAGRR